MKRVAKVRHPPQRGWLDEWGRLKGGRPFTLLLSAIQAMWFPETQS
jgi:hypothetical protein